MDSSDTRLDRMEAQRSTDVSQGLTYMARGRVLKASIMRSVRVFFRSRGEGTWSPRNVSRALIIVVRGWFLHSSSIFKARATRPPTHRGVILRAWKRIKKALGKLRGKFMPALSIVRPQAIFGGTREGRRLRRVPEPPPMPPLRRTVATQELRNSLFNDLPSIYVKMDPDIFSGVSNGSKECVEKLKSHGKAMECVKSVQGDSILHLAARWNHPELVQSIILECPRLLLEVNSKGQLPIHVAAHAGNLVVVEALVATIKHVSTKLGKDSEERVNVYVVKDKDGDTPLHLALKRRYMKIASCLVKANQQASFLGNNEGISPLYMAIETGDDVPLLKAMLGNDEPNVADSKLEGRKYLAHAALKSMSTDMLNVILEKYPKMDKERDEEGRTCLSFGVLIGFQDGVCNLLDRSTEMVYVCNEDGSFPIHIAVETCRFKILEEILARCPDSKHLLNKQGQNMLHIAAKFGQHRLVRSWMLHEEIKHLGSGQDVDGNTPLHLATINWRSNCISILVWYEDILHLRNNSGLRARDIAESKVKSNYIYEERLTLALLLYATHTHKLGEPIESMTKPSIPAGESSRDYVNTLLLVAALIATMTFAAGFTMPGGFNSSRPHLGRATLATNPTLFIFLLVDTLAMQCSFATIATLIWAQMGDPALAHRSLNVALPLLLVALLCMPLAFLFGMVTAVGYVKSFLTVICVISSIFFYWALFILGPHVLLQLSDVSPDSLGKYLVVLIRSEDCFRYLHHKFLATRQKLRRRLCGISGRRLCGNFDK